MRKNEFVTLALPTIYTYKGANGSVHHERTKWLSELGLDIQRQIIELQQQLCLIESWCGEMRSELCDRCEGSGRIRIADSDGDNRQIFTCDSCKGSGFHKLSLHNKGAKG